jgi:hypothetical protein
VGTFAFLSKFSEEDGWGIAYQTTSGLKIVSHILGALFSPGLVLIAIALLANKKPNLFFLPQFKCLRNDLLPYVVVLTCGTSKIFLYLK